MAAPDLPVELWLEILRYLPRSALHKMVGLSRVLFELAMDDLYEEIRFISDDKEMLKAFDQMKFVGIATRVRRLLVQPAFLPALEEQKPGLFQLQVQHGKLSSRSRWWFRKPVQTRVVPAFNPLGTPDELEASRNKVLRAATGALKLCYNLQQVTIVLHDHTATPHFITFLESLWQSRSLGPNLRSLSIRTTPVKLPLLLLPLKESSKVLVNLEEITFNITSSRVELANVDYNRAVGALKTFFFAFGKTLSTISLSSTGMDLLETVLGSIPPFPKLRKFELLTTLLPKQSQRENLSKFIAKHADILEHLTIKPYDRRSVYQASDIIYALWINPVLGDKIGPSAFTGVVFPNLKSLDVGLRDRSQTPPYRFAPSFPPEASRSSLLPNLSIFAPNITSLTLADVSLSFPRIRELLNQLSQGRDGGSILEKLNIMVETLSPPVFDILAAKLPHLGMLTIDFNTTSDLEHGKDQDRSLQFRELMRARRYPRWKLQYLRLTSVGYSCGARHPRPADMGTVAESLPSGFELDCSYNCYCNAALAAA